jgi:hypothetical protein
MQMIRSILNLLLPLVLTLGHARGTFFQLGFNPVVTKPLPGEIVQGKVAIDGTTDIPSFVSSQVDFAYADDPTGTWFRIADGSQAVHDELLGTWDTTTITDGNYMLRLRVILADGSMHDALVTDLHVRNYTPVETSTPRLPSSQPTGLPTATATAIPYPTPTTLPSNPASVTPVEVSASVAYGGLIAVLILVYLGLYLRSKK